MDMEFFGICQILGLRFAIQSTVQIQSNSSLVRIAVKFICLKVQIDYLDWLV